MTQTKETYVRNKAKRIAATFVVTAVTLTLTACGGGGGSPRLSDAEIDELMSDPRVMRLERIVEQSDTLLIPSYYLRYTVSAQGDTVSDHLSQSVSCTEDRCVAEDGTVITIQDLIDPSVDIELVDANLGSRGGFDTATIKSRFDVSESIPGATVTVTPTATSYGLWGDYGLAAVDIGDGPLSGRYEGVPFQGDLSITTAYTVGDVTGTNPAGVGSATWRGVAEAASTRTFERRQGTVTLRILDLSQPRVSADVDVEGYAIGSPAWEDMPLYGGRFGTGTAGRDYLEGNFHGPDHSETYGVFDTGAYIGAFGAKRD